MRSRLVLAVLALALTAPPAAPAAADGGVWTSTIQATQGFDHLSAFPDGTFYAQYLDSYARSTDAGRTWQVMPKPPGHYYGAGGIEFGSPQVGYASGGQPGLEHLVTGTTEFIDEIKRCGDVMPLRRTIDGGKTWRALCVPSAKLTSDPRWRPEFAPFGLAHGGRTIMVSGNEEPQQLLDTPRVCGDDADVVYTSHDAGERWTRAELPRGWFGGFRQAAYDRYTLARLTYGDFKPTEEETCASGTTGLFLSRDGGKSFRRVLTCQIPVCTSVAFSSRNRIVVGRADGSTLISYDAGQTWRRGQRLFDARWQPVVDSGQLPAYAFWVQGISFTADGRYGYASTRGSGTWRTTDGGSTWTQERSHECAWYLWGVGEVATGSKDTAITGGPHFISARTAVAGVPEACAVPQPELPRVAPDALVATAVTAAGHKAVRADGSVMIRR
jgi:photosystem II stability/assembly factor-like uncharacterized protein